MTTGRNGGEYTQTTGNGGMDPLLMIGLVLLIIWMVN